MSCESTLGFGSGREASGRRRQPARRLDGDWPRRPPEYDRSKTVIGAGSVVAGDIPDDVFAAGNPCGIIREITE